MVFALRVFLYPVFQRLVIIGRCMAPHTRTIRTIRAQAQGSGDVICCCVCPSVYQIIVFRQAKQNTVPFSNHPVLSKPITFLIFSQNARDYASSRYALLNSPSSSIHPSGPVPLSTDPPSARYTLPNQNGCADIKGGAGPATALSITDIAKPTPTKAQALVKVKAFGLNRMDLLQREGKYPVPPQAPKTLGVEFSGTIEAFGDQAERGFKMGDEVFGLAYGGESAVPWRVGRVQEEAERSRCAL